MKEHHSLTQNSLWSCKRWSPLRHQSLQLNLTYWNSSEILPTQLQIHTINQHKKLHGICENMGNFFWHSMHMYVWLLDLLLRYSIDSDSVVSVTNKHILLNIDGSGHIPAQQQWTLFRCKDFALIYIRWVGFAWFIPFLRNEIFNNVILSYRKCVMLNLLLLYNLINIIHGISFLTSSILTFSIGLINNFF